jgi:hypothetical protein
MGKSGLSSCLQLVSSVKLLNGLQLNLVLGTCSGHTGLALRAETEILGLRKHTALSAKMVTSAAQKIRVQSANRTVSTSGNARRTELDSRAALYHILCSLALAERSCSELQATSRASLYYRYVSHAVFFLLH